jgi:Fic family protein
MYTPEKMPPRALKKRSLNHVLAHAHHSLHSLQKHIDSLPKPHLLLAPLFALEALAALESQKIRLSLEEFLLLSHTHSHPKKKLLQTLHYYTALKKAAASKHPINKTLICSIHQGVKKGAPKYIQPGDYRSKQNWIGPEGCKREEARFFPPPPGKMRTAMQDLLDYCNSKQKDPLIHIAIIIAQFLIIHPFMDGNGRTARILIPLLARQKKVLSHPLLFFSRYLKDHRATYFQNLFDITQKRKWEQWIHFFLTGISTQCHAACAKIRTIHALYLKLNTKLKHPSCLSFLFSSPIFSRTQFLQRYSHTALQELKRLKLIQPFKKNHYQFRPLLRLLKRKTPES